MCLSCVFHINYVINITCKKFQTNKVCENKTGQNFKRPKFNSTVKPLWKAERNPF